MCVFTYVIIVKIHIKILKIVKDANSDKVNLSLINCKLTLARLLNAECGAVFQKSSSALEIMAFLIDNVEDIIMLFCFMIYLYLTRLLVPCL